MVESICLSVTNYYILNTDIKGFIDNVDHWWMVRFLKAGIMEGERLTDSDKKTPYGSLFCWY
jgi:hypothetical protein